MENEKENTEYFYSTMGVKQVHDLISAKISALRSTFARNYYALSQGRRLGTVTAPGIIHSKIDHRICCRDLRGHPRLTPSTDYRRAHSGPG